MRKLARKAQDGGRRGLDHTKLLYRMTSRKMKLRLCQIRSSSHGFAMYQYTSSLAWLLYQIKLTFAHVYNRVRENGCTTKTTWTPNSTVVMNVWWLSRNVRVLEWAGMQTPIAELFVHVEPLVHTQVTRRYLDVWMFADKETRALVV